MKIKYLLLLPTAAMLLLYLPSTAQNAPEAKKNVLRVGAGVNMIFGSSTSYGYATRIGYGRRINKYLEAEADIQLSANHIDLYNKHASGMYCFGVSPKLLLTPLPRTFRYIRIGASVSWYHAQEFQPATLVSISTDMTTGLLKELCVDQRGKILNFDKFGFNYFARLYAIDSDKFELFLNWEPTNFLLHRSKISSYGYNTTINFGIKF